MENIGSYIAGMGTFFFLLLIWSGVWKGLALWRAAKNDSKPWFVALLVVNTLGILEILYLYVWGKKQDKTTNTTTPPTAM